MPFPTPCHPEAAKVTRGLIAVRYEDIAQTGQMLVEALATGVNETMWNVSLRGHPLEEHAFAKGTLAILTRFRVETGDGPFSVEGAFDVESRFELAHGLDARGQVDRLYLNAWVDTFSPIGRTNLAPPPHAGARGLVGRAFAEHVFTRPFAEPGARKVTALEVPGLPPVPHARYDAAPPASLLEPSAAATPLHDGLLVDPTEIVFGLRHTDSNQHVNSLVYPRLFEECALRAVKRLGVGRTALARTLDVVYRKPCFAGQTARVALRVFRESERLVVAGGFFAEDAIDAHGPKPGERPNAYVRMDFDVA